MLSLKQCGRFWPKMSPFSPKPKQRNSHMACFVLRSVLGIQAKHHRKACVVLIPLRSGQEHTVNRLYRLSVQCFPVSTFTPDFGLQQAQPHERPQLSHAFPASSPLPWGSKVSRSIRKQVSLPLWGSLQQAPPGVWNQRSRE